VRTANVVLVAAEAAVVKQRIKHGTSRKFLVVFSVCNSSRDCSLFCPHLRFHCFCFVFFSSPSSLSSLCLSPLRCSSSRS
jgi:hypothetical protein